MAGCGAMDGWSLLYFPCADEPRDTRSVIPTERRLTIEVRAERSAVSFRQKPRRASSNAYNLSMARGWESKSVESQQELAQQQRNASQQALSDERKKQLREREGLLL